MNKLKYTDKVLLFLSVLLFSIGLVMIFSSSNIAAFMRYDKSPYEFLLKQGLFLFVGIIEFLFIIHFGTKTYSGVSWFALLGSGVALLVVFFVGPIINDARSWIPIGPFNFQPSEFAKVILILWYAAFFELNRHQLNNMFTNFFPLIVSGIICALIILQPDFGTAGIILLLSFMMYMLMPAKRLVKFKVVGISVFVVAFIIMGYYVFNTSSVQRQISRFDFANPCSKEKFYTTGNQVCNSYIAFNNGGTWGKGLGNSTQKYLYLPESHTDFIFAIVVEELGGVISSVIILMMLAVIARIIYIGKNSTSSRGAFMCYGVAIYIFLHISINLLGIMGWLPLTGVPLPFLSYGGSFTLSLIMALSIVQGVAIETKMKKLGNSK